MKQVRLFLERSRKVLDLPLLVMWKNSSRKVNCVSLLVCDAFYSLPEGNLLVLQRRAWRAKESAKREKRGKGASDSVTGSV